MTKIDVFKTLPCPKCEKKTEHRMIGYVIGQNAAIYRCKICPKEHYITYENDNSVMQGT